MLENKKVILGITGSIAAYKGADIASKLTQAGAAVTVVMTESATRFVTPLTFESLTGQPVITSLWQETGGINHITLAEKADVVLIAPATASIIAKLAHGSADDLLSCLVLATRAPVLIAPAMHAAMYENEFTRQNIEGLKRHGFHFVEPGEGRLASGGYGKGRLADVDVITGSVKLLAGRHGDLEGRSIVITAGGTREPVDPVRYIGNRSSGKTGYVLARAGRNRGARVKLITTVLQAGETEGIEVEHVETAEEMLRAVTTAVKTADCLIMAAAVADFRPETASAAKLKKGACPRELNLEPTPDILSIVTGNFVKAGFAAETENVEANAGLKLKSKNLDLVIANDVSQAGTGFESDFNQVMLIFRDGQAENLPLMPKVQLADTILDAVKKLLAARK